ncbi:hypothetical protein YC2023_114741 [Brassica napus]
MDPYPCGGVQRHHEVVPSGRVRSRNLGAGRSPSLPLGHDVPDGEDRRLVNEKAQHSQEADSSGYLNNLSSLKRTNTSPLKDCPQGPSWDTV